jgi:hypothetical protein
MCSTFSIFSHILFGIALALTPSALILYFMVQKELPEPDHEKDYRGLRKPH